MLKKIFFLFRYLILLKIYWCYRMMQVFSYVFQVLIDFCLLLSKTRIFKTVSWRAHKCFENVCLQLSFECLLVFRSCFYLRNFWQQNNPLWDKMIRYLSTGLQFLLLGLETSDVKTLFVFVETELKSIKNKMTTLPLNKL